MSYNLLETSTYSGEPIELYQFSNGTIHWNYTSTDEDVVFNNTAYLSTNISRQATIATQELNKQLLVVTLVKDDPLAIMYQYYPPTAITYLTIIRFHKGDTESAVVWAGRVLNSVYAGGPSIDLHCEPLSTATRRLGLRRYYQRQCPHVLYGPECSGSNNGLKDSKKVTTTAQSVSGLTITCSGSPIVGSFAGGMLSWESSSGIQWRFITDNTSSSLQVNLPFMSDNDSYGRSLPTGTVLSLYPGCQHTLTDCASKFNNLDNYGGFPFTPLINPFGGATLY